MSRILSVALFSLVVMFLGPPVTAQTCKTDTDCRNRLAVGSGAQCIGDVLVRITVRCVSGRCQSRQTSRRNCAAGLSGRCTGGGYETVRGRCNASSGRCDRRRERLPCIKSCSCDGKTLTVSTGKCSPAIGCHRVVSKCRGGCTCEPEPVCKDRVVPKL